MNDVVRHETGYTLIELLIVIAVGSIISGVVYAFFNTQNTAVETQLKTVIIQQNLRVAMASIEAEIKTIGYNPMKINGVAAPGISSAGPGSISFQADLNGDGAGFNDTAGLNGATCDVKNTKVPLEEITIGLREEKTTKSGDLNGDGLADRFPSRLWKYNITRGFYSALAENIEVVHFDYLDGKGNLIEEPDKNTNNIRAIQVTLIARSERPSGNFINKRIYVDQQNEKLFEAPGDNYLRGSLARTIKCRNLGLNESGS